MAALLMLSGEAASALLEHRDVNIRFGAIDPALMVIDVSMAALFVLLSIKADRHWPIALSVLQIVAVMSHLGVSLRRSQPLAYAVLEIAPAYLGLLILLAGTSRHMVRVRRSGHDPSWRTSSPR
ncbi:hypothetical protein [Sphingomonas immobilis]|uniref:Uncharacterized protein n=1 Tax=Sphingomonas immobilis TaxID=3063997 RepID=A0ABT9A192_9SPHN|nr:hypothetical protein [Sphingomonas sp. CA1-15]MDO7843599.1 hypothetical protein [Sphingomonas sp. CA1-15]